LCWNESRRCKGGVKRPVTHLEFDTNGQIGLPTGISILPSRWFNALCINFSRRISTRKYFLLSCHFDPSFKVL
jgi:hypothetical protein